MLLCKHTPCCWHISFGQGFVENNDLTVQTVKHLGSGGNMASGYQVWLIYNISACLVWIQLRIW